MDKIPAIYCDIDGVVTQKLITPDWDDLGQPNENMVRVINSLGRDFTIIFVTGRWNIGQEKVESFIKEVFPDIKCQAFCKPYDYQGSTAEYKLFVVKELEAKGYEFYLGLDDHGAVVGLLHNHGMLMAQVVS